MEPLAGRKKEGRQEKLLGYKSDEVNASGGESEAAATGDHILVEQEEDPEGLILEE